MAGGQPQRVTMAKQSILEAAKPPDTADILKFLRSRPGLVASRSSDGRERATAGIAGLSPAESSAVTKILEHKHFTQRAVDEQRQSEKDFNEAAFPTLEQQLGRVYAREEVIARLRLLTGRFYFERSKSFPDLCGIYIEDAHAMVYEGKRIRLLCSMEWGFSPEWSIPHLESPTAKKLTRGWRDLYLKLVGHGYFTIAAAERVFETGEENRSHPKYMKAMKVTMRRLERRGLNVQHFMGTGG